MGLPYTTLHGSIRFSLSRYTTEAEIDQVIAVMPEIVDRLRALSPFKNDNADWLQQQSVGAKHSDDQLSVSPKDFSPNASPVH
jgi:cysteine desulfurase